MGYRIKNGNGMGRVATIAAAALVLFLCTPGAMAQCVFDYLADIPLDTQEQAAPGMVMFLVDDSGSMDFATMVQDEDVDPDPGVTKNFFFTGGMFLPLNRTWASFSNHGDGVAYVFDNPGDQNYSARDLEGEEHLYWQSQYHGINKMYYNPRTTYIPWPEWDSIANDTPGWSDPLAATSAHDMDPDTARSNPMRSGNTFDLNGDFYSFAETVVDTAWVVSNAVDIIDNTESGTVIGEIIIDNCDAGFSLSGPSWQASAKADCYDGGCGNDCYLTDATGTYSVTWERSGIDPNAEFEVYARWDDLNERGHDIPYTIYHSAGSSTFDVDQEDNGGTWVQLGTGSYTFSSGTATIAIENYEVTGTDNGLASDNEICADAIRLVCVSGCTLGEAKFYSMGPEATASGWSTKTDGDCLDSSYSLDGECLYTNATGDYTATWTTDLLDPATEYDVYTWWDDSSSRSSSVTYTVYDDATQVATNDMDQSAANSAEPQLIASGVTFSSGIGRVSLIHTVTSLGSDEACADAVAFVPTPEPSTMPDSIRRAHYYVQNTNGTYLVNMEGDSNTGAFRYYQVVDSDNDGQIDLDGGLVEVTASEAGLEWIENQRSYKEERVNFANWYSFYRKRELTAKNAIANVVTTMQGVFIGFKSINGDLGQPLLPVNVTINGTHVDETASLLDTLYNDWNSSGGTPLRRGLNYVGEYFSGDHVPGDIYDVGGSDYTTSTYYPFFAPDDGGACEQAFTIAMTDGFWNGSYSGVGDEDGNGDTAYDGGIYAGSASNTLADIAMYYYETDLNTSLDDVVPLSARDKATHQHMVTYGVSFGANGTLDPGNYSCHDGASTCSTGETGDCCPAWPDPGSNDNPRKIDDLYHASVNGRGQFLNAGNPEELIQAMEALKNDIEARLGSAAAVATNSIQRQVGAKIYQGTYHTDNWFGDVLQKSIDVDTGDVSSAADWSAADQLDGTDHANRVIYTFDGSSGIAFNDSNAATIGLSADMINYLRGDPSNNLNNGGTYRVRSSKLGDVVHSAPYYHDGAVYIGVNDGMLHAFSSADGSELFAYVPKILLDAGTLPDLASTSYSHNFYVDSTVHIKDTGSTTYLVGGLRKGGKGYFCLNLDGLSATPSESDAGSVVQWEYSPSSDTDLGFSYSRAYIVETEAAGHVVIFGNGYDSDSEEAVLYVLDVATGSVVHKFETGVTGCNGLATPAIVDVDADGYVDYAYAGDLLGNLWKFNLKGASVTDWGFSYMDGGTPKPLIQVNNASGAQPITVEPDVMTMNCAPGQEGYFVVFGTGRYIGTTDFNDTSVQSFYGVWDWQKNWPAASEQPGKYLGQFTATAASPALSNPPAGADSLTLLEQTASDSAVEWRNFSDAAIDYFNPPGGDGDGLTDHAGWYFNLLDSRARVIRDPLIRSGTGDDLGIVTFISSVPSESPCAAGGYSWLYRVSVCNGGGTDDAQFDTNADNTLDENDNKEEGKAFDDMLYSPIQVGDHLYINDSTGDIEDPEVPTKPEGMSYWRIVE